MQRSAAILSGRAHAALAATVGIAALTAAFACGREQNIHDTAEAKDTPCFSCHAAGYNAATNPVHVNSLPTTCQDCHTTDAWKPAKPDHESYEPPPEDAGAPAITPSATPTAHPTTAPTHRPTPRPTSTPTSTPIPAPTPTAKPEPIPTSTPTALPPDPPTNASRRR